MVISKQEAFDLTPIPHAATVELGRDKPCPVNCEGCAFNETPLERLSTEEILDAMDTLAQYWDDAGKNPDIQLIGERIVEFLGIAGAMNSFSRDDLEKILEASKNHNLKQIAFMADAGYDERAIRDFFELHAKQDLTSRGVIALSLDALPKDEPQRGRESKSRSSWEMIQSKWDMLEGNGGFIKNPDTQNFRAFTTISKQNLDDIPEIAKRVLETGSQLFIAPLTIHSEEVLAQTQIEGQLLMGTSTRLLLTEEDRPGMERVVAELRKLKEQYPQFFLNVPATFDGMLAACKPVEEPFVSNCREKCKFVTKSGEELNATPNIRVVKKAGEEDLSLATCTCFIGLTRDGEDNYANTRLAYLREAGKENAAILAMYRKLTQDLLKTGCPGCNCRTSIDINRGQGLK